MPLRDLTPENIEGIVLPESIVDTTPEKPNLGGPSLVGAVFRKENYLASLAAFMDGKPGDMTTGERERYFSGDFDYTEGMAYPEYEDDYAQFVKSERDMDWMNAKVKQQLDDNAKIDDSGVVLSTLVTLPAIILSPENYPSYFIPALALLKPSVLKGSRAVLVGAEMGISGVSTAIGEVGLSGTQAVRTEQESAFNIAGSVVFTGLLTGAIVYGKMGARKGEELLADLDADQIKIQQTDKLIDEMNPENMGAAKTKDNIVETHRIALERAESNLLKATESGDEKLIGYAKSKRDELAQMKPEKLTELKHPKLARALLWSSPAIRVAGSRVSSAREMMAELVDGAMLTKGNQYGVKTVGSVESEMSVFETSMGYKLMDILDPSYKKYKKITKEAGEKAIPREEFMMQISIAAREGDNHANEFVSKAAKMIRSEITDPIQMRLDAQDMLDRQVTDYSVIVREDLEELLPTSDINALFKEDGTPKASMKNMPAEVRDTLVAQGKLQTEIRTPIGDETYLHRLWDFEAIRLRPGDFDKRVADYLNAKSTEASFDQTVGNVSSRADQLEVDLMVLEGKVKKSKKKQKGVTERSHIEYRAELEGYEAKRKSLREAGDAEGAAKIKAPKRTNSQIAYDIKQEIKHLREVELPKAKIQHDANIKAFRGVDADPANGVEKVIGSNMRLAMQTRAKIEGSAYLPTRGSDAITFTTGVLKGRSVNIPTNTLKDFVENDIEKVLHHYVKGVNAQLHFKERFDPSSPNSVKVGKTPQDAGVRAFDERMSKISDEFEAERMRLDEAGDFKGAAKVLKEKKQVMGDLKAEQEILFDRYKLPDNPSGFWHQAAQRLKEFNMVTMLGFMTVSALPDVGNYIMRRGLKSFARDMARFATSRKALNLSKMMNRRAGVSADLQSMSRVDALYAGGGDTVPISKRSKGGKVLRGWTNAKDTFTQATLMPTWNNLWKNTAATSIIDDLLIDATKFKAGTLSAKKIEQYARFGFGPDELSKITKEINAKRDMIDGVWVPDIDEWADQELALMFKTAVRKEVDMTIVTPGAGDLPLAGRSELGKIILQFKSFTLAANQRILAAGLDDFTADKAAGAVAMVLLGYTSYAARQTLKGNEVKLDYDTFVREGLDRSGMLGIPGEVNAILSKLTSGEADIYRLTGADKQVLSRYASRNLFSTIAGVSAGRVQDFGQIMRSLSTGDYTQSDVNAIRRTIYMNNMWFLHRGFSEIANSVGGSK